MRVKLGLCASLGLRVGFGIEAGGNSVLAVKHSEDDLEVFDSW